MAMLQEESNLNEIVQLVGKDSLSARRTRSRWRPPA